jgi:23S rRNA (uracil1939-C5)-methyltransferase
MGRGSCKRSTFVTGASTVKTVAPVQLGQVITCDIEGFGERATGVGRYEGLAVFIAGALPGEQVKARITKVKKTFATAELIQVLRAHPERVEPSCIHYDRCGGCHLQHVSYIEELQLKRQQVIEQLARIGGFTDVPVHSVKGMEHPWEYRNKVQVPFSVVNGKVVAGFYELGTHDVVDMEMCLIQTEQQTALAKQVKAIVSKLGISIYDETAHRGLLRHVLLREGTHTGETMVVFVTNGHQLPQEQQLVAAIREACPRVTSIQQNINTARTNVILGNENRLLWGSPVIMDFIGTISFAISVHSFFQVNAKQTEVLYAQAKQYAGLTGAETVIDAYCGIGSIALYVSDQAKVVYGMEVVPAAITDAKRNAKRNQITNAHFTLGKAEEILPKWQAQGKRADVLIVDPPRKGCEQPFLQAAVKMAPKRIVYVSCNPATFARDARYLCDHGFRLTEVQPVDMFPKTSHIEVVGLFVGT